MTEQQYNQEQMGVIIGKARATLNRDRPEEAGTVNADGLQHRPQDGSRQLPGRPVAAH